MVAKLLRYPFGTPEQPNARTAAAMAYLT